MALKQAQSFISETEYLQGELIAEVRHEYIDGAVFAMAGASRNHNVLTGNTARLFGNHLLAGSCISYSSELKVKADRCFFYPDVVVVCDDPQGDDYYTERPTLIVEVMSKSTRRLDKTVKFNAYKELPSLREYVLIEEDHVEVEVMRRSQNWFPEHYFLGDEGWLEAIDLRISVAELYHRVDNEDMRDYQQQLQQQAG